MKTLPLLTSLFVLHQFMPCLGETVSAGSGQSRTVALAANETIFLRSALERPTIEPLLLIAIGEVSTSFQLRDVSLRNNRGPFAITGPAVFVFTNVLVTFDRVTNTGIKSALVYKQPRSKRLQVPQGKSIVILPRLRPSPVDASLDFSFLFPNGDQFAWTELYESDLRFDGPLEIDISVSESSGEATALLSYVIMDRTQPVGDAFLLPSASSGQTELRVEKSVDLKTWSPALLYPVPAEGEGFYRLRMQK